MKKMKTSFINLGFSTIIMVFLTICLVTFAALCVLTAHSDFKLSQKAANTTTAYYQADAVARNMTEHIDNTLYQLYQNSPSVTQYYEAIFSTDFAANAPTAVTMISVTSVGEIACISYTVPVTGTQNLHVTLRINYPMAGSECFSTIIKWQTLTDYESDASDNSLNLYTGNES